MKCGTCGSECVATLPVTIRVFGRVYELDECGRCYFAAQRRDAEPVPTLADVKRRRGAA